jgi:hypothetical protein
MKGNGYDFIGWATKYNVKCADGRTIMNNAFAEMDGKKVPLVYNHQHNSVGTVLGHSLLKCYPEGVKAFCSFNNTTAGKDAREIVAHGDVDSLSIMAYPIQETPSKHVMHGDIKEVSLVLSGANPGAKIYDYTEDGAIAHSDEGDDVAYAIIFTGEGIELEHSDEPEETTEEKPMEDQKNEVVEEETKEEGFEHAETTIGDILESMTDEQREAALALAASAYEDGKNSKENDDDSDEGGEEMKHSMFANTEPENTKKVLTHDEFQAILSDALRNKSTLKESMMAHAGDYGIDDIEYLFPDVKNLDPEPQFIMRDQDWVAKVINGVHRTPFSRIRSTFADITADEARAKGYTKGNRKIEEVFGLLKRETTPTTIYKKQKLDKDDITDVTTMDIVAWLRKEMRMMLNEEIARAFLVGDGRSAVDQDKIKEANIRPIWTDDDFYTVKKQLAANTTTEQKMEAIIRSRKDYKGSGRPILFTNEDFLMDMQLLKDTTGHILYDTDEKLKAFLRVSDIVTVPVFEGLERTIGEGATAKTYRLEGLLVNLNDYNVGTDKGGAIGWYDDFDIDFNQYKYLIETRLSGALIKYHAAIAIEVEKAAG